MGMLNAVLLVINGILVTVIALMMQAGQAPTVAANLRSDGFVAILLTACAVILTAVAAMVAIAALWGYNAIKESAIRESATAAERAAREAAEIVAIRTAREVVGDAVGGGSLTEAMWKEDGHEGSLDRNGAG